METARLRYLEKVKGLDLEGLECRRELAETLGIERVSHEDLSRHHCVDWLKAHETHFSRAKLMETADLTGAGRQLVYRRVIVPDDWAEFSPVIVPDDWAELETAELAVNWFIAG